MGRGLLFFVTFFASIALAENQGPSISAPAVAVPNTCGTLMLNLRAAEPNEATRDQLLESKRKLEMQLDSDAAANDQIKRDAHSKTNVWLEKLLFRLTLGGKDATYEILAMMRPVSYALWDAYTILESSAARIAVLQAKESLTDQERWELQSARLAYESASIPFGENYGRYVTTMSLLNSVMKAKGAQGMISTKEMTDAQKITETQKQAEEIKSEIVSTMEAGLRTASHDEEDKPKKDKDVSKQFMIYNLNSPAAIGAAKAVLHILTPELENRYFQNRPPARLPSDDEIKMMFTHNIYAVIAMLKRDLREQKAAQNIFRTALNAFATFYLAGTDKINKVVPMPESIRTLILALVGIKYDDFMFERNLPRIQEIVDVARVRDTHGNYILLTDDEKMELQVTRLMEYATGPRGNDMLITFARIALHTRVWTNLMRAVKERADETKGYSTRYVKFFERMQEAEKRADSKDPLPFMTDIASRKYTMFLVMQSAYGVALEEWATGGAVSRQLMQVLGLN